MRNTSIWLATAAFGSLLLASCGGGDSSPTPTPTPTSTGTATPTPTPTPTSSPVDFDFTKAFTSTSTNASYIFAYFTPTGGSEVYSGGSRRDGTSKITFNVAPESVAYVWPDPSVIPGFAGGDLDSSTATSRTYRKGTDALTMELPFEHVLRVSYERSQSYVRETVPGILRSFRYALFFNPVTTSDAISTNLTYTGTPQVSGGKPGTTAAGVFTATATNLVVAASDKKITGTIRIFETVNGAQVERAALPISAATGSSGAFTGSINDTTNAFKGFFLGSLAGPNREEAFLIFEVAHTDKRELIGSLVAKR